MYKSYMIQVQSGSYFQDVYVLARNEGEALGLAVKRVTKEHGKDFARWATFTA